MNETLEKILKKYAALIAFEYHNIDGRSCMPFRNKDDKVRDLLKIPGT